MKKSVLDSQIHDYSKFGSYSVGDELRLFFPNNEITIRQESSGQYYFKRISGNSLLKQHLSMGPDINVHVCPIIPLNLPEPKTTLLYLDLVEPILVGGKVTSKVTLQYPIEIGVFITSNEGSELVDCFSCDQLLSRFALYGTPTEGHFCKYASVAFANDNRDGYCFVRLDIEVKNNQESPAKLGKIIFDATLQDIYYSDNEVIVDPLTVELETITQAKINNKNMTTEYVTSPRVQPKSDEPFVMDGGYA